MNRSLNCTSGTIALLSQPNVGKSTLFNGLTGSKQHVGNWPGKTVEKKEGSFSYNDMNYLIVDLPGSYSLSANSDEEIVTRDYIADDKCDMVCIMADATQLERSLFMLADYCGINKSAILVLNMMDVAKKQGKDIDVESLSNKLGIPVIAMSAAYKNDYAQLYSIIEQSLDSPKILSDSSLTKVYESYLGDIFNKVRSTFKNIDTGIYSKSWLTSKLIEKDLAVIDFVKDILNEDEVNKLNSFLNGIEGGNLQTGECKFRWINDLITDTVIYKSSQDDFKLNILDQLMTRPFMGKFLSILSLIIGLVMSVIIGMPIMTIGLSIPDTSKFIHSILDQIGAPIWFISLFADALVAALGYTIAMAGLVLGITFVFGFLEELGFMARVSYAFDNVFSKMGLQGKSIMPLMVSFGCNMGGAYSCRVIDTWGQKTLTIALAWAIPCMGCWGVIGLLSSIFFGSSTLMIIGSLFMVIVFHIWLTAKIFKPKLIPDANNAGLIMELPPYHKPKWGSLLRFVFSRFLNVFWKAFKMVSIITVIVWLMSGMGSGNIENTILYKFGKALEPISSVFGMRWQMFLAWFTSVMGKEATLGVFSALFTSSNGIFVTETMATGTSNSLINAISMSVTKPEALAFIFAFTFNIPCLMTVSSTNTEIHSMKWTLIISIYYVVSALIYAFIAYHIGMMIW